MEQKYRRSMCADTCIVDSISLYPLSYTIFSLEDYLPNLIDARSDYNIEPFSTRLSRLISSKAVIAQVWLFRCLSNIVHHSWELSPQLGAHFSFCLVQNRTSRDTAATRYKNAMLYTCPRFIHFATADLQMFFPRLSEGEPSANLSVLV